MNYSQLKLDNQICHRLYMASNSVVRAYRDALNQLDLTYPQYVVMMALWEENKMSIAGLLNKTKIDGGAMTQILKKMTDKQLLSVVIDKEDKRKRLVKLESHGLKLQQQAVDIPDQIRCRFQSINTQEADQLMHLLDKLNLAFENP
ncbi:MarR family winged helix-turn-helix transcriptional regulator [Paraglaciecola arctica]|uniref:MarR family winged helix-turn-helix transcriptional regulator n=1 Tax=Paraglaciecola arctica TaxID=1128911 RepID=UPI001C06D8EF|nr:MarR family transcriptional regulator [Paraglaciecola arctica]MBU3001847.1 MarR family transcriptional regulator [Paraglaciecola arctica]